MFGKKKDLTETQVSNLNDLLEDKFKKSSWSSADFKGDGMIYKKVDIFRASLSDYIKKKIFELERFMGVDNDSFKDELLTIKSNKIIIFNTDIFEAKPIGMVDVGQVKRFGTASTGNRFENGVIGYAIEQASDEVWSKNNAQENSLNEVKSDLLKKTKTLYPNCNMIFRFEADFREMGSSGNVFIYLRGTAAIGKNTRMLEAEEEVKELIRLRNLKKGEMEQQIADLQTRYDNVNLNILKIPKSESDIEKMLG